MTSLRRKLLPLLLFAFMPFLSAAQEVLTAAGDEFSGGDISLSWTLGEAIIETYEDGSTILTQGFHQPSLMITEVDGVEEGPAIQAFPNPAGDELTLSLPAILTTQLQIELLDLWGRSCLTLNLEEGQKTIPLAGLASGSYVLVVRSQHSLLKSFIIIKK